MSNKAFQTTCNQCGNSIKMVEVSYKCWEAFDNNGKHFCNNVSSFKWSLLNLGHPFSCTISCWWCGEQVYYHTNGNGDSVLFDKLGKPWPIHPCWEENKSQQLKMIQAFETALLCNGYNGKDRRFTLIGKTSAYLTIKLKDYDHRILDKAIKQLCTLLNRHQIVYQGPIPLLTKKENTQQVHMRMLKIRKHLFQNIMIEFQNFDLPPSVQIKLIDV